VLVLPDLALDFKSHLAPNQLFLSLFFPARRRGFTLASTSVFFFRETSPDPKFQFPHSFLHQFCAPGAHEQAALPPGAVA
jgi:hypothetical protein